MRTQRRNYDKDRRNYDKDRLTDLPDCLLLQILLHLNTNEAVQTCILSTRWKNIWKDLPVLTLKASKLETIKTFTDFVYAIMSLRNHKTPLQALNYRSIHRKSNIEPRLLQTILNYVSSHNVQLLDMSMDSNNQHLFSLSNFSSHTLTHLNLTSYYKYNTPKTLFPNSLQLPALTYLSLNFFAFRCDGDDGYADPFSAFKRLNTLMVRFFEVLGHKSLFISSVSLVNLTIKLLCQPPHKFELSTPNLCGFSFEGQPLQKLCGLNSNNNLSSIKHVDIVLPDSTSVENYLSILFNWLYELSLMESFTICSESLKMLHLIPDSFKNDFPYLHNLKLLKIETYNLSTVPDGIGDFLLQKTSSAKKVIVGKSLYRRILDDFCFLSERGRNDYHN